jgi:hypothetical protein
LLLLLRIRLLFILSFSWRIIALVSTISFFFLLFSSSFYSRHRLGSSRQRSLSLSWRRAQLCHLQRVYTWTKSPFELDICQVDIIPLASCRYSSLIDPDIQSFAKSG